MDKTLHKKLTVNQSQKPAVLVENDTNSDELTALMQEMKSVWNEAAADLLQPRTEAVEQLLRKVLH